jgi:hypothetical protein
MDLNKQKEQFSVAYVRAVVAAAGYNIGKMEVDEDSVDLTIAASRYFLPTRATIDLQLKCTADDKVLREEFIHFPLKTKNYNDLRTARLPHALVVVVVPPNVEDWLIQTEEEMVMRRCGYWLSLAGQPEIPNQVSVTVKIPRAQQFTSVALKDMMKTIRNKGTL